MTTASPHKATRSDKHPGRVPDTLPDLGVGRYFFFDCGGVDLESLDSLDRALHSRALTNWAWRMGRQRGWRISVYRAVNPQSGRVEYCIKRVA